MSLSYSNPVYQIIYSQFVVILSDDTSGSLYVNGSPYMAQKVSQSISSSNAITASVGNIMNYGSYAGSLKTGSFYLSSSFLYIYTGLGFHSKSLA